MKVIKENKEYKICNLHKPGFEIFGSEIYKKILSTYSIFSDKNFELTTDIINTFKSYLYKTESIKNLFYDLLKNENMVAVLDIDLLFYSKYQENITSQIIDSINDSTNESLNSLTNIEKIYKKNNEFCENILNELEKNIDNIKKEISLISQKWTENRIHLVEKIIIGLAISEFKIYKTPIQVIINEYMNISKEFCGEKSNIFINGLLDPILKKQTV